MNDFYSNKNHYAGGYSGGDISTLLPEIAIDTLKGLSSRPKYLLSKYFYDNSGCNIFQKIMTMPEYYLTNCETEIFRTNKDRIAEVLAEENQLFDLIELGSGDGIKTKILLNALFKRNLNFRYVPIDINHFSNAELYESLSSEMPDLHVEPETGDYLQVIDRLKLNSSVRKIILFLGSNIGNFNENELDLFLKNISEFLLPGDKILIGFDLKKSPGMIIKAYHDLQGLTFKFNLNHLVRLNRELHADFNLHKFEHHAQYNPVTGVVKSYLVSVEEQTVVINSLGEKFKFEQWEPIFMELSTKFDLDQIESLAASNGFKVDQNFLDQRKYFVDSVWSRI